MAFNILAQLTLAYQPIWGPTRQLEAVRLRVRALRPEAVDAAHLLHLLQNEWADRSPTLVVSFADRELLLQALALDAAPGFWLELPDLGDFAPPQYHEALALATERGHQLLQISPLSRATQATDRFRHLCHLWPQEAAQAEVAHTTGAASPVQAGHLYQGLSKTALAAHCLDVARAWGVCGWPLANTLRSYHPQGVPLDKLTLVRVQKALQKDASIDLIEDVIHQDPVLTYRLLQVVNSPVFGAKREIDTIRQALMLLGQKNIRDWLQDQLPSACSDKDLLPVRQTMVLRARLMQYLMSAGPQVELRNEIYLTGLFSQLDQLLNEPLPNVLQRLPLPERLVQALLQNEGPYFAYLDLAVRLEHFERMDQIPEACRAHNFELDDVNRALIRMLAHWNNEI
ncbi:MAG: hypothetical protein RI959_575 [Pseudomonadota bacterium]